MDRLKRSYWTVTVFVGDVSQSQQNSGEVIIPTVSKPRRRNQSIVRHFLLSRRQLKVESARNQSHTDWR